MLKDNKFFNKALIDWIVQSKNSLIGHTLQFPFDDYYTFSNELPVSGQNIQKFYSIKISDDFIVSIEEFRGKKSFDKQYYRLKQFRAFYEFNKRFWNTDISRQKAQLSLLADYLYDSMVFLRCSLNETNEIRKILTNDFSESFDEIVSFFKTHIIDISNECMIIFIPSTYSSLFSGKSYFFEINAFKYNKKRNFDRIEFFENDTYCNQLIANDLFQSEYSTKFDRSISYFDPIRIFLESNQADFDSLEESIAAIEQHRRAGFLTDIFSILNYYYFESLIEQQKYLIYRMMLVSSKKRPKLSLLDVLLKIHNIHTSSGKEDIYFADIISYQDHIELLIEIIKSQKIGNIRQLNEYMMNLNFFDVVDQQDALKLKNILMFLSRLFHKKSLDDFKKEIMNDVKHTYNSYGISFKQVHSNFASMVNRLLEIPRKTLGEKKYLNDFYFNDWNNFLNTNGDNIIFQKKQEIDFLQNKKLTGGISKTIKSEYF